MSQSLDINVIITDPDDEKIEAFIDLQLLNIRDQTLKDGQTIGDVNLNDFAAGLRKVIIQFANQYGDVDEYE